MEQNGTALFYDTAAVVCACMCVCACVCARVLAWMYGCMCVFNVILLQIGNKMVALVK